MEQVCQQCGESYRGRTDKKFCSDQCRSSWHNARAGHLTRYMRRIHYALKRNRRILAFLQSTGCSDISRSRLEELGFDFRYHTSSFQHDDGSICYYCYEQGYLPIDRNKFHLTVVNNTPHEPLVPRRKKSTGHRRHQRNRSGHSTGTA